MTLHVEVAETLGHAASEMDLFGRVASAVRALTESDVRVTHVVVSPSRGEIVVIGDDYSHVALRVAA